MELDLLKLLNRIGNGTFKTSFHEIEEPKTTNDVKKQQSTSLKVFLKN